LVFLGNLVLAIVEVGRHCLGLACPDTQQLGEVSEDEDAGPARHRTLGVTVM